jgi:hypothetical protein
MIDAILRAAEVMMMSTVPMRNPELLCGRRPIGGDELIQSYYDKSWNTLRGGGLEVNSDRTVSMTSRQFSMACAHKIGSLQPRTKRGSCDVRYQRSNVLEV